MVYMYGHLVIAHYVSGRGETRAGKRTLKIEKAARVGAENVERLFPLFCSDFFDICDSRDRALGIHE